MLHRNRCRAGRRRGNPLYSRSGSMFLFVSVTVNRNIFSYPSSAILAAALLGLVNLFGLTVECGPAMANGVFFEPGSPAGKQYALPLSQARKEATGGAESTRGSGASAPLFGLGISSGGRVAGLRNPRSRHALNGGPEQVSRRKHSTRPRVSGDKAANAAHFLKAGDAFPMTSAAGIVVALVLLGCGLGLVFRRLQRGSSSE